MPCNNGTYMLSIDSFLKMYAHLCSRVQTKYLCVLIYIWIKGEAGAPRNRFNLPVKYFTDRSKVVLLLLIFYVFVLSCVCYVFVHVCLYVFCGHLLGKGLTSWLSFVVSNCEFVTFPLVSWVRCGTWLYRFLIFAPLLTFTCVDFGLSL